MADWKRKRKIIKPTETILDTEKFMYREDPKPEEEPDGRIIIDYTLKPPASNGLPALLTSIAGTIWFIICWIVLYRAQGAESMPASACAFSGLLCSIVALFFAIKGFMEKDRNHVTCWVGLILAGLQIITWIISIVLTARI